MYYSTSYMPTIALLLCQIWVWPVWRCCTIADFRRWWQSHRRNFAKFIQSIQSVKITFWAGIVYTVHAYISVDVHLSTAEKSKFIMWVQITVALNIQYLLWMKRDYQDTNRFIASLMPLFIHSFIGVYTVWSIVLELEKKRIIIMWIYGRRSIPKMFDFLE